MQRGRRIAFDFGDVRIGVAVSDPDSILATPLVTLKSSDKNLAKEVAKIFNEIEPVAVYLGRPAHLSGQDGAATEKALHFAELLRGLIQIPIELIDERMSSVSAARQLREAGRSAKSSRDFIDMAAAVAILEFALEIEKGKK